MPFGGRARQPINRTLPTRVESRRRVRCDGCIKADLAQDVLIVSAKSPTAGGSVEKNGSFDTGGRYTVRNSAPRYRLPRYHFSPLPSECALDFGESAFNAGLCKADDLICVRRSEPGGLSGNLMARVMRLPINARHIHIHQATCATLSSSVQHRMRWRAEIGRRHCLCKRPQIQSAHKTHHFVELDESFSSVIMTTRENRSL